MLENINLKKKLSREEYKRVLPAVQQRLYDLEKACWDQGVPTVIVFEGWDASGKGTAIAALTQRLDPRGFKLYPITAPRTYEQQRPWLWRFWLKVPNRGEMVIFDHSWYGRVLEERVERTIPEKAWRQAYRDIVEFERMLADDGTVILKFFLHISKKEQKQRFRGHRSRSAGSVAGDRGRLGAPQEVRRVPGGHEEMLELTESEYAPWTIVEATSKWYARKKVFETIIAAMEKRLGANAPPRIEAAAAAAEGRRPARGHGIAGRRRALMLETLDLTRKLDRAALRARGDAPADSTPRTGLPGLPAEAPGDHRLRGLGRGRQGRRHQAHHREARPARLRGLSDQRAAGRGQDPPLPLPLLAAAAGARADRHLRPLLVRPRAGGARGRLRHAKTNGSAPSRRSTPSSGSCAISARSWRSSGSTSRARSSCAASRSARPSATKPGSSPTRTGATARSGAPTRRPSRRCW